MYVLWLIMLNNDWNVDKKFYQSILNRSRENHFSLNESYTRTDNYLYCRHTGGQVADNRPFNLPLTTAQSFPFGLQFHFFILL